MYKLVVLIIASLVAGCAGHSGSVSSDSADSSIVVDMVDLVKLVRAATQQAQTDFFGGKGLKITKADLTINAATKVTGSGEVSLVFLTFGGARSGKTSNSFTVSLQPPSEGTPISGIDEDQLKKFLKVAGDVADQIGLAADAKLIDQTYVANRLKATIGFTLTDKGNGKIGLEFGPAELSAGGESEFTNEQSVTFEIERCDDC